MNILQRRKLPFLFTRLTINQAPPKNRCVSQGMHSAYFFTFCSIHIPPVFGLAVGLHSAVLHPHFHSVPVHVHW
jgi:hypothetical protein